MAQFWNLRCLKGGRIFPQNPLCEWPQNEAVVEYWEPEFQGKCVGLMDLDGTEIWIKFRQALKR